MAKRPIYRLRSVECDSDGAYYPDDGGYGFLSAEHKSRKIKIVELRIPDLLDDGDVVVISAKATKSGGRTMEYLKYETIDVEGDREPLGSLVPLESSNQSLEVSRSGISR